MQQDNLQTLLLDKQQELLVRREKIHADFTSRNTSKNFSQQSKERENDDVLRKLDQEAQEELTQIKAALKRVESNDFQRCRHCAENISDERLLAIPFTAYCRNCADTQNQQG